MKLRTIEYNQMPVRRARRTKRTAKPRRRVARRGRGRARVSRGVANVAKCTEIVENFGSIQANEGFALVTNLGGVVGCDRARALTAVYKYYRLEKVEVEFIPYYNTFQANTDGTAVGLPELYFAVDRTWNAGRYPTLVEMQERGIMPQLVRGPIRKSYRPSALQSVNLETTSSNLVTRTDIDEIAYPGQTTQAAITGLGVQNSTAVFNKWYMTQQTYGVSGGTQGTGGAYPGQVVLVPPASNPLGLNYYGCIWYIKQTGATANKDFGRVLTRFHWAFKGPRAATHEGPTTTVQDWPMDISGSALNLTKNVYSNQPTVSPA